MVGRPNDQLAVIGGAGAESGAEICPGTAQFAAHNSGQWGKLGLLDRSAFDMRTKVGQNRNDNTANREAAMTTGGSEPAVLSPPRVLERKVADWHGLRAVAIKLTSRQPLEFHRIEQCHFLVALEHAQRYDGETTVEGLPKSTRRDLTHKLTFIPAGCAFSGWMKPLVSLQATLFYIDPGMMMFDSGRGVAPGEIRPRLFFDDDNIWQTVLKLKAQIGSNDASDKLYAEALGTVLAHEIIRLDDGVPALLPMRGGLAAWQQRRVVEFIEEHLADDFPLAALASLAQLSTYHFARAFKRSFGIPPHRYHTNRRIERAQALLADPKTSVTDVALEVGFSGASAFAAMFRKATGQTPTDYRRALE
jgi:AraC family transcriptional regulator